MFPLSRPAANNAPHTNFPCAGDAHCQPSRLFARRCDSAKQRSIPRKFLLRHALCQRANERAVTAAKIDVQRRVPAEDVLKIQPIDQRPWFDDRRNPKTFGAVSRFNLALWHAEEKN